ncbi:MAG: hypothetical protein QGI45_08265, partial [Myxococcota bacterium]|nr:hypothetical protein [Myxococcota bacterium]
TSFYMWRSYYMTFTGEYRGGQDDHGHHGDDDHGHHGGEPHESPRTMTWVLVALAALILPTAGLGFWPLIHIEPIFEHWLHPVAGASMDSLSWFSKSGTDFMGLHPHTWEYILAGASVSVAMCGWLVARALYKDAKNPMPGKLIAVAGEIVPKAPLADHVLGMRLLRLAGASFFFAGGVAAVTGGSTLGMLVFVFGMLLTFILAIFGIGFCLADDAGLGEAALAVTLPLFPMFLFVLGMQYFRDYQVELGFIPLALAVVQLFRALPKQDKAGWMRTAYQAVYNKYYIDELYDWMIVRPSHFVANFFSNIDKKLIDGFVHFVAFMGRLIAAIDGLIDALVVDGLILAFARGIAACGNRIRQTQTGQIQTYLLGAAAGALTLVFFNFLLF